MTKEQAMKAVGMSREELAETLPSDLKEFAQFELHTAQELPAEQHEDKLIHVQAADAYYTLAGVL